MNASEHPVVIDPSAHRFPGPQLPDTWGDWVSSVTVLPGVTRVRCRDHGGVQLSREHNARIPFSLRQQDGLYEEDIEIWIPAFYLGFPDTDQDLARLIITRNFGDLPDPEHP